MATLITDGNANKVAVNLMRLVNAISQAQAVGVSVPEDVQALGRPQTGPEVATTPQPPPQAPPENKAGSGSTKRRPPAKAG